VAVDRAGCEEAGSFNVWSADSNKLQTNERRAKISRPRFEITLWFSPIDLKGREDEKGEGYGEVRKQVDSVER
jgi:hypothetical protein